MTGGGDRPAATAVVHRADAPPPPARRAAHRAAGRTPGRGRSGCSWASWRCRPAACYLVARERHRVVGLRRADAHRRRRATSPPSPSIPTRHRHRIGTRLLLALARDAHRPGRERPDARGADVATTAPRSCTAGSASPRPGSARTTTRTQRGRVVMWAHDVDSPPRTRAERPSTETCATAGQTGTDGRSRRSSSRCTADRERSHAAGPDALILGIETSCDETAAARRGRRRPTCCRRWWLSQVDLHARYGGVVPEIASRAHVELLIPVVAEALVEAGIDERQHRRRRRHRRPRPGRRAAGRASARPRPWRWCGTCRSWRSTTSRPTSTPPSSRSPTSSCPLVVLLVSGGHTMLVDGGPRALPAARPDLDDAAGEAFDKVARFLGLGYPGGPAIDRVAMQGDPRPSPSRGRCSTRGSTSPSAG